MKFLPTILVLVLFISFSSLSLADEKTQAVNEKEILRQVALDYIESWYQGNAERMARALHPEMSKISPETFPRTGNTIIRQTGTTNLLEFTRAGFGSYNAAKKTFFSVEILDVFRDIANVKVISADYVDYLHMAKINGQWKILQVLWLETKPPQPENSASPNTPPAAKNEIPKKGDSNMSYYFSKTLDVPFEEAIERVTAELKKEGFGILTQIDVKETLKKKLDVDFRQYRILGACNPPFAYKALQAEDKIGVMLPCNVIVQEIADNKIEVAAVDPIASMQGVGNTSLGDIASQVQAKLKRVIDNL